MIAHEIQLRYVIRDKIQSETKFSPKKKSETKFSLRKRFFVRKKKLSWMLSQISSAQSEQSWTNGWLSSVSSTHTAINHLREIVLSTSKYEYDKTMIFTIHLSRGHD